MSHEYLRLVIEVTEYCGGITESQKDRLLEILEKATREEYRKRAFKKRFKFHPFEGEPNRGTIEIDGDIYRVDIGKSEYAFTGPSGIREKVGRKQCCYLTTGDILIDSDIVMRLQNKRRIDSTLYHEVGHAKFQGTNLDKNEDDEWILRGHDPTMSPKTLEMLLDKCIRQIYSNMSTQTIKELKQNPTVKEHIDALRFTYLAKLKNNPHRDKTLQEFRDEAITIYKLFDKGGHTNWSEFEADRYASNKTSVSDNIKALKEYDKELFKRVCRKNKIDPDIEEKKQVRYDKHGNPIYHDEKHALYNKLKAEHKRNVTDDIIERAKVLKHPLTQPYKDIYK